MDVVLRLGGEPVTVKQHWAEEGFDLDGAHPLVADFMLRWFHALYYAWMPYGQIAVAVDNALDAVGAAREGSFVWVVVDNDKGDVKVEGAYKSEAAARTVKRPQPWVRRTVHRVVLDEN